MEEFLVIFLMWLFYFLLSAAGHSIKIIFLLTGGVKGDQKKFKKNLFHLYFQLKQTKLKQVNVFQLSGQMLKMRIFNNVGAVSVSV